MDIQKEKIAHEKHLLSQGVDFKYLPNIQYSELENVYELIEWDEEYSEALNEINSSWCTWQTAKAQAVPEGFVLVEKKNTEDWYLDDCEGMWWNHDGIDGSLCELDIGEVQAVEHKEYLITENNTLYATRVWDDANDQVDCWQFFKTKEEAEKAAAYCKAKFYEEAQEPAND